MRISDLKKIATRCTVNLRAEITIQVRYPEGFNCNLDPKTNHTP